MQGLPNNHQPAFIFIFSLAMVLFQGLVLPLSSASIPEGP